MTARSSARRRARRLVVLTAAVTTALAGSVRFGHVPVKLAFLVGALTLATLWAILKSLLVRSVDEDPGERLDLSRYPKLRALLDDVAERVGTRPVDNVYLVPGTTVAVMERGGRGVLALAPKRERCLILGAGVLEGFRLGPLRAVLAHEYGHFSNRDTAGGGFALSVRRSLLTMAHNIARGGAAAWHNPAWLFVNGFYRVFLRISEGASRLQEVLADRWAALVYGSGAFERGLRHVIERTVRFNAHVQTTLKEVVESKKPLRNVYDFHPAAASPEKDLEEAVRASFEAPPSPYDSHPSPRDRVAWVRNLAASGSSASMDDDREAWSLFPDREAIEAAMTGVIRDNVLRQHGIAIAAAATS